MNLKLNSNVSVVKINESVLEFFKTNTRKSIKIKINLNKIIEIINSLDGTLNIDEISNKYNVDIESLKTLFLFLDKNSILDHVEPIDDFYNYKRNRRTINFLSDFSKNHDDLVEMWNNIINSKVLVIGLGGVGTWVAANLVQMGVNNIAIMDNDIVELSNLHRQFGFTEKNIGSSKVDVIEEKLLKYNKNLKIIKIKKNLDENVLDELPYLFDLIINCADIPNVDITSRWVGEYGMKTGTPHIVGGGYNLHLSLIGQTIIPFKTACVKCYEKQLEIENKIDKSIIKKMEIRNRKIGSIGPMCSLISSFIGMEAIKILSKKIKPANINRRGEFDMIDMKIKYKNYDKLDDCCWCGEKNGKYKNKECKCK